MPSSHSVPRLSTPTLNPFLGASPPQVAAAYGCRCSITMPDDAAIEKANMIQAYGASVRRVRPVSIVHPEHPVNVARREAASTPGALFADQFENEANFRAHLKTGTCAM